MISARDIREFRGFLRNATDRQVQGIYDKEARAGRDEYAELAVAEAERRGIYLERASHARKKVGHARKTKSQLDREIAEALKRGGGNGGIKLEYDDPEIEQMFRESGSKGTLGEHDKTVVAVLGDPMYARHFKMPKWNRKVTVLDTPDVAVRHWSELGIPRLKGAHQQRADYFRDLLSRFQAEHQRLIDEGERAYGKHGSLIAGGFREDWPPALKDRIRFVSYGSSLLSDAARLHEALSKSRSPVFHW